MYVKRHLQISSLSSGLTLANKARSFSKNCSPVKCTPYWFASKPRQLRQIWCWYCDTNTNTTVFIGKACRSWTLWSQWSCYQQYFSSRMREDYGTWNMVPGDIWTKLWCTARQSTRWLEFRQDTSWIYR